jgi:THAP4-like, heme-binding beta-barrel domain
MYYGLALLGGELANRAPQPVVGDDRGAGSGLAAWTHVVEGHRGPAGTQPDGVGGLAVGDGVQPRPEVVAVAQSGIGAKSGHECLLQAVLRRIGTDATDQEPMELGGVVVHQALKRRQAHTSFNAARARFVRHGGRVRRGTLQGMAVEPLLAQLLGTWRGSGMGEFPNMVPFRYDEEIRFVNIGSRDLLYLQKGWDPESGEVLHAEAGMWRATPDGVLAATIAQPRTTEVAEGKIRPGLVVLVSTHVGRAANAAPLVATRRTYRLSGDKLTYVVEITTLSVTDSTRHLVGTLRHIAEPETDPQSIVK